MRYAALCSTITNLQSKFTAKTVFFQDLDSCNIRITIRQLSILRLCCPAEAQEQPYSRFDALDDGI